MTIKNTQQRVTRKFDDEMERIFGGGKKPKGSYIQDPETGKLVPKSEYVRKDTNISPTIMGDIQDFVSPIDNTLISDRGQLRRHMAQHGVTNSADYSPQYIENKKKAKEAQQARDGRADRIDTINRAIAQHHNRRK